MSVESAVKYSLDMKRIELLCVLQLIVLLPLIILQMDKLKILHYL